MRICLFSLPQTSEKTISNPTVVESKQETYPRPTIACVFIIMLSLEIMIIYSYISHYSYDSNDNNHLWFKFLKTLGDFYCQYPKIKFSSPWGGFQHVFLFNKVLTPQNHPKMDPLLTKAYDFIPEDLRVTKEVKWMDVFFLGSRTFWEC